MIKNIINTKYNNIILISVLSFGLIFSISAFAIGINGINGLVILGVILALIMGYVFIKYEKFWVYSLMAISPAYFYGSNEGVDAGDIIMFIYITLFTFFWIFYIIMIKKEKIVHSISDWLILMFFFMSILAMTVSFSNNVSFIDWAKEFSLYSACLIYFPLKYYIKEKKDFIILLTIFAIAILGSDFYHYYLYKNSALKDALYAYQLGYSIRINQTIFTTAAFSGLIFAIYSKKIIHKVIFMFFSFSTTLALVVTFSRTFWVILLVLVAIAFLIIPLAKKRTMMSIIMIVVTLALSIAFLVFKNNTMMFFKVAENRFTSTGKGVKDISIKSRLVEYEEVYKNINDFPLGGNGLGAKVRIFDYFKLTTSYLPNIHNAYLFSMHRWGIPLAIIFYFIIGYNFFFATKGLFTVKDDFYKILTFAAFGGLMTLIVSGTTSSQFFMRDGQFVIALSLLFVQKINSIYGYRKNPPALSE